MDTRTNEIQENLIKSDNFALSSKEIISLEDMKVSWREAFFDPKKKSEVLVHDVNDYLEMHFQFNGFSKTLYKGEEIVLKPNSQIICHLSDLILRHEGYNNSSSPFSFFEIKIGKEITESMFPKEIWEDVPTIKNLFVQDNSYVNTIKTITPQMYLAISDMCNNPFRGYMKKSFVEAKIVELFLLQIESQNAIQNNSLRKSDKEKIIAIKEYLDKNYKEKIRIIDLARMIGTNQQTLKKGFKELFNTTIWGYYNGLRMEAARNLLINKEKNIAEVAEEVGYKNPQHFTVAFKKKFGILPRTLKDA